MGKGGTPLPDTTRQEVRRMRIWIYPVRDQVHEVLVVPSRRARMAPILVRGASKGDVAKQLPAIVRVVEGAEALPDQVEVPA